MTGNNNVPLICQVAGTVVHVILCYILVWKMDLEIAGVGIAASISNFIIYICLLQYSAMIPEIQDAIQWPNKRAFRDIGQYLALGIPSALMLCLEWWAFEVMTLITGYIGVDEQASQVIIINIVAIMYMVSLGI